MTDPSPPPSPTGEGDDTEQPPPAPLPLGPIGRALAIAGPALVVIAGFLEWAGRNFPTSYKAHDIPAKFVIDADANLEGSGLKLGVLVILVGVVGLVGALVPRVAVLVWACGAVAVVIALLFAVSLNDFMDRANRVVAPGGFGIRNTVGIGAALCGLGGVVTLAGAALGFVASRRPS
jgi:hypothetical protein